MQKTNEFMLNRIKWKAGQYKLSAGYTFYFDELNDEIKKYLITVVGENPNATPGIFFTNPSKEWTLVCTKQVFGLHDQKIFKFNLEEIASIDGYNPAKIKTEWNELTVLDKQNNQYILHTNNGYDNIALHGILLMCKNIL